MFKGRNLDFYMKCSCIIRWLGYLMLVTNSPEIPGSQQKFISPSCEVLWESGQLFTEGSLYSSIQGTGSTISTPGLHLPSDQILWVELYLPKKVFWKFYPQYLRV